MATATKIIRTVTYAVNPIFKTHEVAFRENGTVVEKKGSFQSFKEAQKAGKKWAK